MAPPKSGSRDAAKILGKSIQANKNGFARVYSDDDEAALKAAGWTVAGVYVDDDVDDTLTLRKAAPGAGPTRAANGETLIKGLPATLARRSDAAIEANDRRAMLASKTELEKLASNTRALAAVKAAPRGNLWKGNS
jgi:hypothetical protein